jgi:hypothetical protein
MRTHAEAAKMMRQELKKAFPLVKFSVRSSTFAGGDSVDVQWDNGPVTEAVRSIVDKYQYGHFNGMEDIYEHTNSRNDIPQVKYVQVQRTICESIKEQVFKKLQETHEHFNEVFSMDECNNNLQSMWNVWTARDYIYRILVKLDLTNGYQEQESV